MIACLYIFHYEIKPGSDALERRKDVGYFFYHLEYQFATRFRQIYRLSLFWPSTLDIRRMIFRSICQVDWLL
jgi:hypothetical protein